MTAKYPRVLGATLDDAEQWVEDNREDGAECPCCGQLAKVYKRPLNVTMARGLIWLVREAGPARGWVEVRKVGPTWLLAAGGEFAKLAHWELIEEMPHDTDDTSKRTSGIWRPTLDGVGFVHGRVKAARRVHLFNNEVLNYDSEYITIKQALGKKFDYDELMRG